MNRALELFDSRVSQVLAAEDATVRVVFSHGYVHQSPGRPGSDPGTGWSQELAIVLHEARVASPPPVLPNQIAEGFLEFGNTRLDLIPLPFKRRGPAALHLTFSDGSTVEVEGAGTMVEILSAPIFLEDQD